MELYKIAAIAKKIYEELISIEIETCRKEWQYSLYYVILRSVNNNDHELIWEENHSQWNINHLFRGQKNTLRRSHPSLEAELEFIEEAEHGIRIKGRLMERGRMNEGFEFELNEYYFIPLEVVHPNGRQILFNAERYAVLESILELEGAREPADEQEQGFIHGKINTLTGLLGPIRRIYAEQDQTGKNFIETVVGASIFYLPHPVNECFSGHCSIKALNEKINGRRIVREHITPRKYAARQILNAAYNPNDFSVDFTERFRRFMYLTPQENRETVNYAEYTHDEALANLDIEKFPVGESPFVNNHKLFMSFTAFCKEKKGTFFEVLNMESATDLLYQFLVK